MWFWELAKGDPNLTARFDEARKALRETWLKQGGAWPEFEIRDLDQWWSKIAEETNLVKTVERY